MGSDLVLSVFQYSSCLAMSSQRCPQMAPLLAQGNKAHRIHVLLFWFFSARRDNRVWVQLHGYQRVLRPPQVCRLARMHRTHYIAPFTTDLNERIQSRVTKGKRHTGWSPGKLGRASKNPYWSHSGWNWVSSKELWQLMWCCPQGSLLIVSVNGFYQTTQR